MKKILSVLLCVTLVAVGVFAFAGCTKTSDLKYDVALITDGGSIHDKAYNQSAWDGVQTYANENSAKAVYYQPALEENQELTTDVVEQYVKLAVDKGAKYIVLPGETFAVICYELATMYPELHFVLLDAVPHSAGDKSARLLPNVMSASFDDLQSGYLAGFSAVLQGNTKLGSWARCKTTIPPTTVPDLYRALPQQRIPWAYRCSWTMRIMTLRCWIMTTL